MSRSWCGWIALAMFGAVGCGFRDMDRAASGLPRIHAEAVRIGLPQRAEDVAHPRIPDALNAHPLFADNEPVPIQVRKDIDMWLRTGQFEEAERELARLAEMPVAHRLAEMQYAPARDYDHGQFLKFPEFATIASMAHVCMQRAVVRASQGNVAGAIADLRATLQFEEFLAGEPVLIGVLNGIRINNLRQRYVEMIADLWSGDAARLETLRTENARNPDYDPVRAIKADMYWSYAMLRNYRAADIARTEAGEADLHQVPDDVLVRDGLPKDHDSRANLARLLELYVPVVKELQAHDQDRMRQYGFLERFDDRQIPERPSYTIALSFLPLFDRFGEALLSTVAKRDLSRLLVASLEFRIRKGKFPASISEIDPDAIDPFSRKPYRYRVEGDGFLIWSIGPDGVDNDGLSLDEARQDTTGEEIPEYFDEVVRYPRLPASVQRASRTFAMRSQ